MLLILTLRGQYPPRPSPSSCDGDWPSVLHPSRPHLPALPPVLGVVVHEHVVGEGGGGGRRVQMGGGGHGDLGGGKAFDLFGEVLGVPAGKSENNVFFEKKRKVGFSLVVNSLSFEFKFE